MPKTIKFKDADSLVEYCIKKNKIVGQVWVEHNPYGEGQKTLLYFVVDTFSDLCTSVKSQTSIKGVDYDWGGSWHDEYRGTFELVLDDCDCQHQKPEVYKVGDWVEILKTIKNVGNWNNTNNNNIGKIVKIDEVKDDYTGVYYSLEGIGHYVSHYYLKKVEQPAKEMTIEEVEKELGYKVNIIK